MEGSKSMQPASVESEIERMLQMPARCAVEYESQEPYNQPDPINCTVCNSWTGGSKESGGIPTRVTPRNHTDARIV